MMEKQNKVEKQAVGDADMTDYVVDAAVAEMDRVKLASVRRPGVIARKIEQPESRPLAK